MGKKVPKTSDGQQHVGKVVPRKKVGKLFLYDSADDKLKTTSPFYAENFLKIDKKNIRGIKTWAELGKVLGEYESIEQLILDFHGSTGSIKVGNEISEFTVVLKKYMTGPMPAVTEKIDFESCNVGLGPDELIPFAKRLSAPKVMAWNYFHVFSVLDVTTSKGDTAEDVQKVLKRYDGYFTEGNPTPDELVKKPGKHKMLLEWFRDDDNAEKLDPTNTHTFKKRKDANSVEINSSEAAAKRKEYDDAPSKPLDHVIITLSGK